MSSGLGVGKEKVGGLSFFRWCFKRIEMLIFLVFVRENIEFELDKKEVRERGSLRVWEKGELFLEWRVWWDVMVVWKVGGVVIEGEGGNSYFRVGDSLF